MKAYLIMTTLKRNELREAIKEWMAQEKKVASIIQADEQHITWEKLLYQIKMIPLWTTASKEQAIRDCRMLNKELSDPKQGTQRTVCTYIEIIHHND